MYRYLIRNNKDARHIHAELKKIWKELYNCWPQKSIERLERYKDLIIDYYTYQIKRANALGVFAAYNDFQNQLQDMFDENNFLDEQTMEECEAYKSIVNRLDELDDELDHIIGDNKKLGSRKQDWYLYSIDLLIKLLNYQYCWGYESGIEMCKIIGIEHGRIFDGNKNVINGIYWLLNLDRP